MTTRIVAEPSLTNGVLSLHVDVDGAAVRVDISRTRAVGVPDDLPLNVASEAMRAGFAFQKGHQVLIHLLFMEAPLLEAPKASVATLEREPELDAPGSLLFQVYVNGTRARMRLTPTLDPRAFKLNSGDEPTEGMFYATYDAALEYLLRERDGLQSLGFDTGELDRQLKALPPRFGFGRE